MEKTCFCGVYAEKNAAACALTDGRGRLLACAEARGADAFAAADAAFTRALAAADADCVTEIVASGSAAAEVRFAYRTVKTEAGTAAERAVRAARAAAGNVCPARRA